MLIRTQYEQLIYTLPSRCPSVRLSTLVLAPPGIKHHRIPAPGLSFNRPNMPVLIAEIERELLHL